VQHQVCRPPKLTAELNPWQIPADRQSQLVDRAQYQEAAVIKLPKTHPLVLLSGMPIEIPTTWAFAQTLRFSDFSIHAAFSSESLIACSRSAVDGSASSTSSCTERIVSTAA
jgi:hypothetical protein